MRQAGYLRQRYRAILAYTGMILLLCAAVMLLPLFTFIRWPDEVSAWAFVSPSFLMGGLGATCWFAFRPPQNVVLSIQEGGIIVFLSWIVVSLFSTWPFIATGLTFTQAAFESVSGWTTTGLSVVDVTAASHGILLWRSVMQAAGGAGLAVIMLSAITGPTGPALSAAEGRDQLVPHVRQSAKIVMIIYSVYLCGGTIALYLAGMGWFDAVNHSLCAVSTGGFSTRPESIGYWDSVVVEGVTIPLMLLGNLSFLTAWLLLHGKVRAAGRNGEVRIMVVIIPLCALLLCVLTARSLYPALDKAVRVAIFETVTALTTTGYSTVGYGDWNAFGWLILIILMLVGGGTCSTAGGIKQYRVYLLFKALASELRRRLLPGSAIIQTAVWEGENRAFISHSRLNQVGTFVFLYLCTVAAGTAILTAHGYGLGESLFEFASTVGTVGLSIGVTSPDAPPAVLWTQVAGMLLGRLEFFVVFTSAVKLAHDSWVMRKTR